MAQETNGADCLGRELKDTRHAACKRGGNKLRCEHGKMSVDFPNEAARCQRFSSGRQSNFEPSSEPRGRNGPAATMLNCEVAGNSADVTGPTANMAGTKLRSICKTERGRRSRTSAINVRAKRQRACSARRPWVKVIVDHDPAAIVEQVAVATPSSPTNTKNVRAIGRAHHSARRIVGPGALCRIRLPCYLMQNTRSKGRGARPNSVISGCGSAW